MVMRTHSTNTVATIVLEPKVQVGAPRNESGFPITGYAQQHFYSIAPGIKNRLKGYTRQHTCTTEVSDFNTTVADF